MQKLSKPVVVLFLFTILMGCNYIAPYDEVAYKNATELKIEAVELVKKSVDNYDNHRDEVELLKKSVLKAYEYAKNIPKNEDTAMQYEIIISEDDGGSLFGFLQLWQNNQTISEFAATETAKQIAKHFDELIKLEVAKISRKK